MLLHFAQTSPGDYVPQESILQALGISAEVSTSKPPQVSPVWGALLVPLAHQVYTVPLGQYLAWLGTELQPLRIHVILCSLAVPGYSCQCDPMCRGVTG